MLIKKVKLPLRIVNSKKCLLRDKLDGTERISKEFPVETNLFA